MFGVCGMERSSTPIACSHRRDQLASLLHRGPRWQHIDAGGDLEIGARLLSAAAGSMLAVRMNSPSAGEIAPCAAREQQTGDCKPPVARVTSSQRQSAIRFVQFVRSAVVPDMQSRDGCGFRAAPA
jgi:hypothetical protein